MISVSLMPKRDGSFSITVISPRADWIPAWQGPRTAPVARALGRAILAAGSRLVAEGRLLAPPRWHSSVPVKATFAAAFISAPLAGWFVYTALRTL